MATFSVPTSTQGAGAGAAQTAAKATAPAILHVDPSYASFISPKPPMPKLICRYNPKSLKVTGGTEWAKPTANQQRDTPNLQFKSTKARTLTVDLFVDLFMLPYGNVDWELKALQDWCKPRANPRGNVSAPYLRFRWGEQGYFKCYLDSYTITYTLFSKSGAPMRATVNVVLKEVPDPLGLTNPSSGGVGGERRHVTRAGDTLHSIAFQHYGQPRYWRGLAAWNGIDDPLRVGTGAVVSLPDAETVEQLS